MLLLLSNLTSSQACYCVQLARPGSIAVWCLLIMHILKETGFGGCLFFGNFTKWTSFLKHLKLFHSLVKTVIPYPNGKFQDIIWFHFPLLLLSTFRTLCTRYRNHWFCPNTHFGEKPFSVRALPTAASAHWGRRRHNEAAERVLPRGFGDSETGTCQSAGPAGPAGALPPRGAQGSRTFPRRPPTSFRSGPFRASLTS